MICLIRLDNYFFRFLMAAIFFIKYRLDDCEEENPNKFPCPVLLPLVRHHIHEKAITSSWYIRKYLATWFTCCNTSESMKNGQGSSFWPFWKRRKCWKWRSKGQKSVVRRSEKCGFFDKVWEPQTTSTPLESLERLVITVNGCFSCGCWRKCPTEAS